MSWRNRVHAGQELARLFLHYHGDQKTIVVGLPRGGVVVAAEVAAMLRVPLDIVVTRKISAPHEPELAIGAIDENGVGIFNDALIAQLNISPDYIHQAVEVQKREVSRRMRQYRGSRPSLNLEGRTAIVVDDGVATGFTMMAAIRSCHAKRVGRVVVAVPVVAADTLTLLQQQADEVVCLISPKSFMSVGQFYEKFEQTTDVEVRKLMEVTR